MSERTSNCCTLIFRCEWALAVSSTSQSSASARGIGAGYTGEHNLVADGARPFLPLPAHLAGPLVEWGLNWCIGTKAHQWTTIHAAVVERGGRVLIMPAPSGSGKTTLCAALAFSGWRLFSDEFALVDADTLRVHPTPRPLSLKDAAIEIVESRHPDVVYGPEARDVEGARYVHARPPTEAVERAHESAAPADHPSEIFGPAGDDDRAPAEGSGPDRNR